MRRYLAAALVVVFLGGIAARGADVTMDEPTKKATAKALEWLAGKQNSDGSWSESKYPHNTAITSFALLAFMAQGHLPNQGLYGPEVAKGARFLLSSQRDDGYCVGARGGNMYCHAMATLALAELWGMTGDDEIKNSLKKATQLVVGCQHADGGWRYQPTPSGSSDISVTIMQVMALRAAKNSGMHVPDDTLKKAISYIERCYNPQTGGFMYMPTSGKPGFARTAAGTCVLQLTGQYKAQQIPKAIAYLKDHFSTKEHFWYGHYYAAHAMHQVGGKEWADWYAKLRGTLLPRQAADGSWSTHELGESSVGATYQTSIAVIILSVPANYLPIFQN